MTDCWIKQELTEQATTLDVYNGRIIVIGASAGAVEALSALVAGISSDLPAAILVVYHQSPHGNSYMPSILRRNSTLPVAHASDGELIEPGHIYLARPDHHLLVKPGYMRVMRGPRENNSRPAVDPLFRTSAKAYGSRTVGVVLTGNLDDGTTGLAEIKAAGGVAIVQDPTDAPYPGMPQSAIDNVQVDFVLPLNAIADLVNRLAAEPMAGARVVNTEETDYPDPAEGYNKGTPNEHAELQQPSIYTCPQCHGTLFEISERNQPPTFRCRVGHAYSVETLGVQQSERIEEALYIALRALEERASLADRLAERARDQRTALTVERFTAQAADVRRRAAQVRKLLKQGQVDAPAPEWDVPDTPVIADT